ncbi:hypothetical protein C7A11_26650 [Pseudomonas simiae]|uniref:hypothetical protein n=1 Tax=Pseudomonas simiae TaxID=321846 RepID=UPI000D026139|nr:hypothetical protein [Pseudomonas simiae]PRW84371.1 hypothetical protein C7A11_26650 [Pseudomonas simiae]
MNIINEYALEGLNTQFIYYIHTRLGFINNDDLDFIETIDHSNTGERVKAIDEKILEVKYEILMSGKTNVTTEALEALRELKERLIYRKKRK